MITYDVTLIYRHLPKSIMKIYDVTRTDLLATKPAIHVNEMMIIIIH